MASSILLRNGTLLIHDEKDRVKARKADLLVVGNEIAEIAVGISAPSPDTIVIDCASKIISPGFIDTHHHLFLTPLKGRHGNDLMLDFLPKGNFSVSLFTPEDIFWGELGGCLESIDSGTTMVVDHANMNYSAEHSSSAISGAVTSGIRSYFCYTPTPRVASWSPFQMATSLVPDWVHSQLTELAQKQPFGDGRVRLGFAFDGYYLPKDAIIALFEKVRALGIKLITSHYTRSAVFGTSSHVSLLNSCGLLKEDILFSHANGALPEDAVQLAAANAHISATPETELQMGLGAPVCFRPDLHDISSLGVDCHTNNSGDMMSQMRLALQSARGTHNESFLDTGKIPRRISNTVEEAYNLGTIKGARAVGMEAEIGSIAVGKLADLVIFDGESPAMVCAAEHDPVAAIVLHASVRDIDTVIVDGRIRKAGGKLTTVELGDGETMQWKDTARELLKRRERVEEEISKLDLQEAKKAITSVFHIDEGRIVDSLS
ncbi:Metallo-dependent hydrolase [Mycena sanguinolenta]|uniref:Metallo-dependent hydrolase n=1 Tax=Mycena sanguinolenta TaxID=230812 RepID=A0A8H6YN31_9AGAR|nr:Metallo-dependent hydrolase [Mycena sanguinolenta]